jgi:2-succinyl-5-enolpyruvyl-6-hydroxy-3-cyclohexene-1-carboxylate synthase
LTAPADTHLLLRAFVDELVRCGVTDACTSPGSRSTPLVLALVRDGRLRCTSQLDERAGGFFALGLAKASRRPVVLACTSGTAAAEYLPAVVEAHEAGVPLLVLTADRPPELREVGAGQTIDQVGLYGRATRWFFEVGTGHEATPERARWMRALACRAVWAAHGPRPGPVHLNWPLREPLVPPGDLGADPLPGRADGRPWLERPAAAPASSAAALDEALAAAHRPVVVAGRAEADPELPAAVAAFAERLGAPLLADPLSRARRGPSAIAHYDALLRVDAFRERMHPDLVVRVGDLPTSKPLRQWLAALDARQVAFAPESVWHDPDGVLATLLGGDPRATLDGARALTPAPPAWLRAWRQPDERAGAVIDSTLCMGEPLVARALVARLPPAACLVVASSMPVRDVETFAPVRDDGGPRVLANRGANGIDGTVATALGVAASGAPTVLLIGDVALVHDLGGLASAVRLDLPLAVVCLDNDGGGIFEFLPVAEARDAFEEHVATPPGLDLPAVAAGLGLRIARPTSPEAVGRAIGRTWHRGRPALIHVPTDRRTNVVAHREMWDRIAVTIRTN